MEWNRKEMEQEEQQQQQRERKEKAAVARLAMMELSNMLSVPMSLNAVVRLNVPAALHRSNSGGGDATLTASEILAMLDPPPPPTASAENLQRILRLLSSCGVFREHPGRRYSLTDVGRTLVPDPSTGDPSYAAYVLQHHQDALVRAWPVLHEAVLDPGVEPFVRANGGVPAYEYYGKDAEANELMQRAMWGVSKPFMDVFLDRYGGGGGFDGVETLVDVGGSSGVCLSMIMDRFPGVKAGVNFDLPDVVAAAPSFKGVSHVGGDMFKSIPSGDAIFMKWVLTTWTDEESTAILKNCHDALPPGGKVIACEPVLPEDTDESQRTRALLEGDIFVMAIYRAKGKERTEEEFRQLGVSSGFRQFEAFYVDPFYTVLEFKK